jgi:hypothetical protein
MNDCADYVVHPVVHGAWKDDVFEAASGLEGLLEGLSNSYAKKDAIKSRMLRYLLPLWRPRVASRFPGRNGGTMVAAFSGRKSCTIR